MDWNLNDYTVANTKYLRIMPSHTKAHTHKHKRTHTRSTYAENVWTCGTQQQQQLPRLMRSQSACVCVCARALFISAPSLAFNSARTHALKHLTRITTVNSAQRYFVCVRVCVFAYLRGCVRAAGIFREYVHKSWQHVRNA